MTRATKRKAKRAEEPDPGAIDAAGAPVAVEVRPSDQPDPRAELEKLKLRLYRTDAPVMRDGSVVIGGMWPAQRAWWGLTNDVQIFSAGYGAGKSSILRKKIIALSLANDGVPSSITAPTYAMGRNLVAIPLAEDLSRLEKVRRALGQEFSWTWRKSLPNEFTIHHEFEYRDPHGHVRRGARDALIIINSGDDPEKLKGANLGSYAMEEPFMQEFAVFDQLEKRRRHPNARYRYALLSGTPEGLGWGFDLAEGEKRSQFDVGVVYASTFENLANPSTYAPNMLRSLDARASKSYVYGRFENLSTGLVYYAFDKAENVVNLAMPEGAKIGLGLDFNVNPMAAVVFWYVEGADPHVHVFDEIELPNSDTKTMAETVLDTYAAPGSKVPICVARAGKFELYSTSVGLRDVFPDPSGKARKTSAGGRTDFGILEECGFEVHARSQAPAVRDRENSVNALLRPADGRIRHTVAPWCTKLVKYQMAYTHERRHLADHKAMGHLLDARDYPIEFLFPMNREQARQMRLLGI